jgi:type II secretory pathway component PulF
MHKIIKTQYERTPSKKEIVESSIIFGALFLFTVFLLFNFLYDIQYYKLITIILIYIFSYLVFKKKYYNRIYISKRMPKLLREYKYA